MAGRSYNMDGFTVFFRRVTRIRPYIRTSNTDRGEDEVVMSQVPVFNPYDPYEGIKYEGSPPHGTQVLPGEDPASMRAMHRYRQSSVDSAVHPLVSHV